MSLNGCTGNQDENCDTACTANCWTWNIPQVIMETSKTSVKYAVIVLNRPITQHLNFIKKIWKNATITMTVDGGTRQWDQFLQNQTETVRKALKSPDLLSGDFDSIGGEVLEKYTKKGCKVIHTPDQNHTDFTKAILELNIHCNGLGVELEHVIAIGQASGRIDQIIANIQSLFLARDKLLLSPNTKLYLLSDDGLSWLLSPGEHYIKIPEDSRKSKKAWCSLIPVGETCKAVTSTGLKWNLDNQPLKFGSLVSTSNTFSGTDTVTVKCSHTLLWSMRIPSLMKP